MITMEAAVLIPGSLVQVSLQLFWPFELKVVSNLHQHLIQGCVQGGEVNDSSRGRPCPPVILPPFELGGPLSSVKSGIFCVFSLPFTFSVLLGNKHIFCIHVLCSFKKHISHGFWLILQHQEEKLSFIKPARESCHKDHLVRLIY